MASSPNRAHEYTSIRGCAKIPNDTRRLECVKDLIKAARSSRFSALRKLSANDIDVFVVWDSVSKLTECHMAQQKAVHIPGLGSFTFTTSKLEVGHNKFILIQRPVFILSEKLVRTHRLTQSRYHVPGEIPVIQLNFTALSYVLNLDRDLVEASIKEVVNALSHQIEQTRSCEFAFTTIGNLLITNGNAKMKFLPSFLEKMGQKVGMLSDAATSVLADKSIVLPKIQPGKDIELSSPRNSVDAMKDSNERCTVSSRLSMSPKSDSNKYPNHEATGTPVRLTPSLPKKDFLAIKNSHSKQTRELLTPTMKVSKNNSEKRDLTPSAEDKKRKQLSVARDPRNECEPRKSNSIILRVKPSKTSLLNLLQNKAVLPTQKPSSRHKKQKEKESSCGHCSEHCSDFCYLCFQRNQRNIPIDFNAERKREEEDEDKILQAYILMTDAEALRNDQQQKQKNRQNAQEIAAFNLGVAENLKKKNDVRPENFERSFVFHKRPVTPPHYIKQEDYQEDLAQQVSEKQKRLAASKKDSQIVERKEQLKLADELADQWKMYLKDKAMKSEQYRKALDAQVSQKNSFQEKDLDDKRHFSMPRPNVVLPFQKIRVRTNATNMMDYTSSELPAAYSDSDGPIFGICDRDDKKILERRQRAQSLYQDQLGMAAKKRELSLARSSNKKKEEEDMLNKTKKELLEETLMRNALNLQQRKELEKTWAMHDMKKKSKEIEEKLRSRSPGLLLQEQCDKYDSCGQCKRKPTNYGRSNVWCESRYVSGSRLMV